MLKMRMAKHFKNLTTFLLMAVICSPAHAVTTTFRVWGSAWLDSVPNSDFGKVFEGELSGGALILHVPAIATGGAAIDPASGKILVQGDRITLCYKMKAVKYPPNAPIPSVAYFQALEYTIEGLPEKKYLYQVSQDCE